MKNSENNDQYLTKTVISARSQKVFDLHHILTLYVHSCVCARPPKTKRSQAKFAFDAVDAASHIYRNYGTISLKLWESKCFPLRYMPFERALSLLYSILTWSIILCFCSGPARLWHRGVLWEWCPAKKPARQVKDLKANHENVIRHSVGDIVALGARASWRTSCGSPSENIEAYVEAENASS